MSITVWLVSDDFVSTPFALKQQLEIPSLPLLATCVRLMMMSRMKNWFFHCTHPQMVSLRRKYAFLFSQTGSCLLFYTRKQQTPPFPSITYFTL
jgi:hypothetical protein